MDEDAGGEDIDRDWEISEGAASREEALRGRHRVMAWRVSDCEMLDRKIEVQSG